MIFARAFAIELLPDDEWPSIAMIIFGDCEVCIVFGNKNAGIITTPYSDEISSEYHSGSDSC